MRPSRPMFKACSMVLNSHPVFLGARPLENSAFVASKQSARGVVVDDEQLVLLRPLHRLFFVKTAKSTVMGLVGYSGRVFKDHHLGLGRGTVDTFSNAVENSCVAERGR